MYFATYLKEGKERLGVLYDEGSKIIDVASILGEDFSVSMLDFIENCDEVMLEKINGYLQENKDAEGMEKIGDVKLCAPIPQPRRSVICLGLNYKDHVEELKASMGDQAQTPKAPVYFGKMATDIIGPMDEINSHPNATSEIDYEVELAIIIGKTGMNIPIEEAENYIFGYTILNDLSARDLQKKHAQWIKGKSLDTFTAMGPYIIHKSTLPLPLNLKIACKVNDEIRQNSNTSNLIFNIPYIISDLSKGMTLKAGDIIATGTPGGVGMGFNPPKYLKTGDVITCTIEKIGELVNKLK
ncbi:2-keto-4-pentenoate hydratase/2-oxohepta-3-ene-1,7-dioic acid hydratase (catechol pathway) [Natronincola peptidivorans]|uniref:2-keto-4-pentenoate hydratase/2-oxohepta-3-ene-1,7-dioic acid hydratase (Catechol pathway) n=1 Tax=Natronincola peptidivorans TaxID=426128 RepID=A0A1I0GBZ1_9FIRM|nr:fumarylacetoacetate hydrolase family protein [Natronincola peptidivorans]SET67633.1 2-keto-4-pentenoate hydratase/2-oxohepta-3-ene-1,7-dioic acid hydratase (catechol pathway) [Natronincola peptidivorans]